MKKVADRLEALKTRLVCNWGELAEHLGISRAMLDFLRFGKREPSPKFMRTLIELEQKTGLALPTNFQSLENSLPQSSNHWKMKESKADYGQKTGNIYEILGRIEGKIDRILEGGKPGG